MTNEHVSDERLCERAAGTLLGAACGDALGVPYEFDSAPFDPGRGPEPIGGGLGDYAPGEWSDDTQMAMCIARVAASGIPIDSTVGLDAIASGFLEWMAGDPADVGNQTRALLTQMLADQEQDRDRDRYQTEGAATGIAARMTQRARDLYESTGHTAGNGALMRTAPVALAFLEDRERTAKAARRIAQLTHTDPLAGDSCVLWCEAIRATVLTGGATGPEAGLDLLPPQRRGAWTALVDGSWRESGVAALRSNGFTVTALYAALHAVEQDPRQAAGQPIERAGDQVDVQARQHAGAPGNRFRAGIAAAVAIGGDTDTVAAIAGALLGSQVGAHGIPAAWRQVVHGWPGMDAEDLTRMAGKILRAR